MNAPPKLRSFSADTFRQWLAGLTDDHDRKDYEEIKPLLFDFVGVLPLVYNFTDRVPMWSRIAEHIVAAADSCGDDIAVFIDDVRERLCGEVSAMLNPTVAAVLNALYQLDPADQSLAVRIVKECPSEVVMCGKNVWVKYKESSQ